jgi:hypothetical protein
MAFQVLNQAANVHMTSEHPAPKSEEGKNFSSEKNRTLAETYLWMSQIRRMQGRRADAEELRKQAEALNSSSGNPVRFEPADQ